MGGNKAGGKIREETTQENQKHGTNQTNQTNLLPFETTENDFFGIQLTPEVYELVDINNAIKQKIYESDYDFKFYIIPVTISMKLVLTTSNHIHFNSRLNFHFLLTYLTYFHFLFSFNLSALP